jgi:hypothetical protein
MELLKRLAATPDRQISFLFEPNRLEGLSDQDRDKIVAALAQILTQASGLGVEELDDDER